MTPVGLAHPLHWLFGEIISRGNCMGIVAWIVLGLIAGAIAKALMPGKDPGGLIVTILIGIVGAFVGGALANAIMGTGLNGFSLLSVLLAIVGAMLLLWLYRLTTRQHVAL